MASETFEFMYRVTFSHGTYQLADANPFRPGVNPVDHNGVRVTDHGGQGDSRFLLGDIPDDKFQIHQSPGHNGSYTFVTLANDSQGHGGFIAEHGGQFFFITDDRYTGGHFGNALDLDPHPGSEPICFMSGTMIRTPSGEAAVETLKRGDLVATFDGRVKPVSWLGRQTVSILFADPLRVLPIRIKAGAISEDRPERDLLLSPDHAVLVDGMLIHAGALVNHTSIVRETDVPRNFSYYHVELEDHSLVLAENLPAETFIDSVDRRAFDNWEEHRALFPDGKTTMEMPYPRAKSSRQVSKRTRARLDRRVEATCGIRAISAA